MNFIEFVDDLRLKLVNKEYADMLWETVRGEEDAYLDIGSDAEVEYEHHLPLDFGCFLENCVSKLRFLVDISDGIEVDDVTIEYLCGLILYTTQKKDALMDNRLHAADMFFLLNMLNEHKFYYKTIYQEVTDLLNEFCESHNMTSAHIILVMNDFKTFLGMQDVTECNVETVGVLSNYSYFNDENLQEAIDTEESYQNLGHLAFAAFQVLVNKWSQNGDRNNLLYWILLGLTTDLVSSSTGRYPADVLMAHKHNVRFFIRANFGIFSTGQSCLIYKLLRCIFKDSKFDDYEGIARIVEELPLHKFNEVSIMFINFLQECDTKTYLFNYIVPFTRHPSPLDSQEDQVMRVKIMILAVMKLLLNARVADNEFIVGTLSTCSELPIGIIALKDIMKVKTGYLNRFSILEALYKKCDKSWKSKHVNVGYITFMCNLCIISLDIMEIKNLNELRGICITGAPYDLRNCVVHFKRILEKYCSELKIVIYILNIFDKLMHHEAQSTSSKFAKELHEFIFTNIASYRGGFIWSVLATFFSEYVNHEAIIYKFYTLSLLSVKHVRLLLAQKSKEPEHGVLILKLLLGHLKHLQYNDPSFFMGLLQSWHEKNCPADGEIQLVLLCLLNTLQRRGIGSSRVEIETYRLLETILSQSLSNRTFPDDCIENALKLFIHCTQILKKEGKVKDMALHCERELCRKLEAISEQLPLDQALFKKDIMCIKMYTKIDEEKRKDMKNDRSQSSTFAILSKQTFARLETIIQVWKQPPEMIEYLCTNDIIIQCCLSLYSAVYQYHQQKSTNCTNIFKQLLKVENLSESLKLTIMLDWYGICKEHLKDFATILPVLFDNLTCTSARIRFNAMHLIMKLVIKQHLRLVDGQYLIFVGLLADENKLIKQHMEIFMEEEFFTLYHQTVARYFVPSIVHFNHYYDHPIISLTSEEQQMMKKTHFTFENRCSIYYHLFEALTEKDKFNILKLLALDIFSHIASHKNSITEELVLLLNDALVIVMFVFPRKEINDMEMFYKEGLQMIKQKLLANTHVAEARPYEKYHQYLEILLKSLFDILYSTLDYSADVYQNILFTIITITDSYLGLIKRGLGENDDLKTHYLEIQRFYERMGSQFAIDHVTINVEKFDLHKEKTLHEFYLYETVPFKSISEDDINRFSYSN